MTKKRDKKLKRTGRQEDRFAKIAKLGEVVFHAKDLANLWQIRNKNTLYTTLKRYSQKGLLFRVYKGLYSVKPINEIDPLVLGFKALHRFAYLGAETVLSESGIIQQNIGYITLVSSLSKKFSIAGAHYYSRKLENKYLYQTVGIIGKDGVKTATVERAVADLLYFNPQAYFDADKLINWREVEKIQKAIGYPLTPKRYDFAKSQRSDS